jgi:hypothetical protein
LRRPPAKFQRFPQGYLGILAAGLLYVAYSIYADIHATGMRVTTYPEGAPASRWCSRC